MSVSASDERRIEVIASGLAAYGRSQLAVDVTIRSPLDRTGAPRPRAHWQDGASAESARHDKEQKYPELVSGSRCRLTVLAVEIGGRFSNETAEFIQHVAASKAQAAPRYLRKSAALAFERRWSRMLAFCVASAHCSSLSLDKSCAISTIPGGGREPRLQELLTAAQRKLGDSAPEQWRSN